MKFFYIVLLPIIILASCNTKNNNDRKIHERNIVFLQGKLMQKLDWLATRASSNPSLWKFHQFSLRIDSLLKKYLVKCDSINNEKLTFDQVKQINTYFSLAGTSLLQPAGISKMFARDEEKALKFDMDSSIISCSRNPTDFLYLSKEFWLQKIIEISNLKVSSSAMDGKTVYDRGYRMQTYQEQSNIKIRIKNVTIFEYEKIKFMGVVNEEGKKMKAVILPDPDPDFIKLEMTDLVPGKYLLQYKANFSGHDEVRSLEFNVKKL